MQLLTPVSVHKQPRQFEMTIGSGVKTTDIVVFTRMFATMIDSGLPICSAWRSSQPVREEAGRGDRGR